MLTVTIQMDRTTALVIQDIAAMENRVKVIKPEKKIFFFFFFNNFFIYLQHKHYLQNVT